MHRLAHTSCQRVLRAGMLAVLGAACVLAVCAARPALAEFKVVGQEPPTAAQAAAPGSADGAASVSTSVALPDLQGRPAVPAEGIADGAYPIEVASSSSMFRIVAAELVVSGDEMHCALTLSGKGYEKLFMGTGDEAAAADGDAAAFFGFVEDADGRYVYTVPVEALDAPLDCAAFSIRRQRWYDRTLVFLSQSLPDGALLGEGEEKTAPASPDDDSLGEVADAGASEQPARTYESVCVPGAMCMRVPSELLEATSESD